ncbi:MAG TPA: DNA mismatch repair endonuclease MutL [Ktedonobacteraceae bacterium]|jgi:DNA mismatch repair protein MutL|nr:DNA mismatch repair endonuclease MutL [Ktedonobacteraceae bacterium]
MPIRQLAPDVAAKIAAGEVVERPASVVKELIENSIDAGATQIRVDLMGGGLQLIRVSDNGSGIPLDELPLALSRHATSKVASIDDLEHIRSLGFRGEALASIAAVADVTLLSRHRDAEQGAQISASNGQLSEVTSAASPVGTTLTVRNLFSAVPARLKFLKSRNTEVSHCHHLLEQYALAYPEIRFSVFSEGRQIFATPGDGQLSSVLVEIYGLQVAEQMVPISSLDGNDEDPLRPVVTGYTSLPTCYKSTRQHMSFFVNRRWVMSRMLSYAVEEAYHSLLLTGRHPIAVVNIAIDPSQIDVNVHPAKTEIRFLRERRVYAAILRAVRRAILEEATVPQWGRPDAALQVPNTNTSPTSTDIEDFDLPDEEEIEQITTSETDDAEAVSPSSSQVESEKRSYPQDNPWLTVIEEESGTKPPMLSRLWQSHIRKSDAQEDTLPSPTSPITNTHAESDDKSVTLPVSPSLNHIDTPVFTLPETPAEHASTTHVSRLPQLRVIGQLLQSYIVTEAADGMYLIDQHAAHERILLERMVADLKERKPLSQLLLTPLTLELAPAELEAIEEHWQKLEHIGFSLATNEDGTLEVRAVPNVLIKQMNARSLRELLAELTAPENLGHSETWEEHALANVACKAAIKQNYFLTVSEMREMIEQLGRTNAPFSCCHGRPTMVQFSLSALEREFGRR